MLNGANDIGSEDVEDEEEMNQWEDSEEPDQPQSSMVSVSLNNFSIHLRVLFLD